MFWWLILFNWCLCRNISSEMYKAFYIFSVKLTMAMEIAGFIVRLSSSLLWFQIYRLGASIVDTSLPRRSDSDSQNSFVDPPTLGSQQRSRDPDLRTSLLEPSATSQHRSDEILDDSIEGLAYQFPPCDGGGQNNISSPKAIHVCSSSWSQNLFMHSLSFNYSLIVGLYSQVSLMWILNPFVKRDLTLY